MGSANTPANILKIYQQLNLTMCSINIVDFPKSCTSYIFWNVFEHCLKMDNMIVIGVYKSHDSKREDQKPGGPGEELLGAQDKGKNEDKTSKQDSDSYKTSSKNE